MAHLFGQHNLGYYRKPVLNSLDRCLLKLQEPFCAFINLFVSSFILTTMEVNTFSTWICKVSAGLLWLTLSAVALPSFLLSFPIWCSLQRFRTLPFKYISHGGIDSMCWNDYARFTIGCANLCLIPEALLRFNNQLHNESKAHRIGYEIVKSQRLGQENKEGLVNGVIEWSCKRSNTSKPTQNLMDHDVNEMFPRNMDILCIQEGFHLPSTEAFVEQLCNVYPYIIYDAGINSLMTNGFIMNSGLLIASKYPIVAASFYVFRDAAHYAYFTATGLLLAKVNLGVDKNGVRHVGLIGSTHLQAYQGISNIHKHQLDNVKLWCQHFRSKYFSTDRTAAGTGGIAEEVIMFDVVCGDFNIDNLSPVDEHVWDHDMFTGALYTDPCIIKPGLDQPWTVATEFRSHQLYSSHVCSPHALKQTLLDDGLRRAHLLDGMLESVAFGVATKDAPRHVDDGSTVVHENGGRRRIDRILLNSSEKLIPEKFYFITQLATLTDHIPVALTFTTAGKSE